METLVDEIDKEREAITKEAYDIVERETGVVIIDVPEIIEMDDILEDNPKFQCRLCNQNRAFFISLPCKHRWICVRCLENFAEDRCAVCDKLIKSIE